MQKWGKTKKGKQRYYCVLCKKSSIRKRKDNRTRAQYFLFVEWLTNSTRLEQIARSKKRSVRQLEKVFQKYWQLEPTPVPQDQSPTIIVVDGVSVAKRKLMALIAQDPKSRTPVYWTFTERENYASWVEFCSESKKQGIIPAYVVCDG